MLTPHKNASTKAAMLYARMQGDGEDLAPAMLRIMDGGPDLWRETRGALARKREALHARSQKCAQDLLGLAAQLGEGKLQPRAPKLHERVSCFASTQ